jgi:hypothetical protein
MTRIQPECFIEVWRGITGKVFYEDCKKIKKKEDVVFATSFVLANTIAIFLIKPQLTTLAERLEARKVNNNLNGCY